VAQGKHKGLPVSGCRLTVRNVECLSKQVNRIKIEPLSRVPGSGFGAPEVVRRCAKGRVLISV